MFLRHEVNVINLTSLVFKVKPLEYTLAVDRL